MSRLDKLTIKIFADCAELESILRLYPNPMIKGFTTNPTLMRKAGITDYEDFAFKVIAAVPDRPISLEVFADDLPTMEAQARVIASWGKNVTVKIPVTNTKGEFTGPIVASLSAAGVVVNVTALMTVEQVRQITDCLHADTSAYISVFAGRIADTGRDPVPMMSECVHIMKAKPKSELIWASPREVLNIFQADEAGCHIITITNDMLGKLSGIAKNLDVFSLETVEMFYRDATAAGYSISL